MKEKLNELIESLKLEVKEIKKSEFGLKSYKKLVLVVSGSLGSNVINEKMIEVCQDFKNIFEFCFAVFVLRSFI